MHERKPHEVITRRAWLRRAWPFPHIVARDVFVHEFYSELAVQLGGILARGLTDAPTGSGFARGMSGYDAYGISITKELGEPLSLFVSAGWRDLMSDLFGIGRTPYVFAGAHHHTPCSADGFIHNDFNPVWFPRAAAQDAIQVPDAGACDFKTGAGSFSAQEKVQTVRGAVVIFYLLNDGWQQGDGGETGLFRGPDDPHSAPAARCLPENNSLVAFECTPQSYHAFLASRRPRTSVIMWVHRMPGEAFERHGEERLERWQT